MNNEGDTDTIQKEMTALPRIGSQAPSLKQ